MKPRFPIDSDVEVRPFDHLHGSWAFVAALHISKLLCLLLLVNLPIRCTTIIAMHFRSEILIGVDSLETSRDAEGNVVAKETLCKVVTTQSEAYVTSGTAGIGSFDVRQTVRSVMIGGDFERSVDLIGKSLKDAIAMENRAKPLNPARIANEGKVSIVIGSTFRSRLQLKQIALMLESPATFTYSIRDLKQGDVYRIEKGDAVLSALPKRFHISEAVAIMRAALKAGIDADSDSGFPVSILRISARGIEWIEKGACFNIREAAIRWSPEILPFVINAPSTHYLRLLSRSLGVE